MADSASYETILLPGFGRPLNYKPTIEDSYGLKESALFPNALDKYDLEYEKIAFPLLTLRELAILGYIDHITDKENWEVKIFDENIQANWRAEMVDVDEEDEGEDEDNVEIPAEEQKDLAAEAQGADNNNDNEEEEGDVDDDEDEEEDIPVTEAMADWVIAEVKSKVDAFKKDGYFAIYHGQVVKSDTAVPVTLREALKEAIKVLEDVPEKEKDWHPGSDGKVLDLVHPSLFPLVYGKSRVLKDGTVGLENCIERCGNGEVVPVPPVEEDDYIIQKAAKLVYSSKFQWLPCDVALEDDGVIRIKSYINNLYPQKHANLYNLVEQVIARAVPLWNAALTPLLPANSEFRKYRRIPYMRVEYEEDDEEEGEKDEERNEDGDEDGEDDDEDEDEDDEEEDEEEPLRTVVQPEPGNFEPPPQPKEFVDLFRDYKEKGLQVIVKLANIELTPENPTYDGGSWHVEGQINEHICASAIYYYDSHNITESRLAFRRQGFVESVEYVGYEQNHHEWLEQVFGCYNEGDSVQGLGSAATPEGRLLAWPNVLQHRVCPFELEDKSRRGWRKILALFLVDPHIQVISTANVPVQRVDWWAECIKGAKGGLPRLPLELQDAVMKEVDFPMSLEEAKDLRVELMEERKVWHENADLAFQMHTFSLCEH